MSVGNKVFGCLTAVLMLSACAGAVFPDFDDNLDEMEIHEGGRVVHTLPEESDSLKADTENAAYENEIDEDTDKVEPAETTPVETEELDDEPFDEQVDEEEEKNITINENSETEEKVEETPNLGASISYKAETIYFDNGSSYVSPKYNSNLRNVAKLVKENNASVIVYGHSSSRTRDTDPVSHKLANFKASMERAQNVASALKRVGVPADKITIEAMSDSAPAYQEVMPEGERLNRRAEIYIAY
ncbi:MAG: OmpA family protein [Alphaproteobacteria bacterium]|nr:OmpA family protein [Alphaproteobacteria bacterium]